MIDKNRMYQNMIRLVEVPSVSGTAEEALAAYRIEELLYEIPYFQEHRNMVMRIPLREDPYDRFLVAAYLGSASDTEDTIILTGHYDVVDAEEYGVLKEQAYNVEELSRQIGKIPLDESSLADLKSGEWLFGRGTADMKFGHALCLELLRHYSEENKLKGNLLYLAVCGEETNSEGMLCALPFLNQFAEEQKIKYKLMLLTECFMVDKADDGTKYIQYGAAGKVMPMFFCVGAATHGEEPFLGLDANLLSSEVYRQIHLNSDFCQQNHGITTAPPAGLKQQDMKTNYALSTALYAASYYNIATVKLQPEELMDKLVKAAETAFQSAIDLIKENVDRFASLAGSPPEFYNPVPRVITYREIFSAVQEKFDGDLTEYLKKYATDLMTHNPEMQHVCVQLVKRLYELYDMKGPAIIVSLIPPYYPDVNIDPSDTGTALMLKCADEVIRYAYSEYGETLKTSEYYGISDLCYSWLADGMDFDKLFDNLVGLNMIYQFPTEDLKQFKVPGIVLGGYGKDLHKYTERLHKHYNFDVLPDLYVKYIEGFLNGLAD